MDFWLDLGKGPLFRLSFVLMILGLARVFILSLGGMLHAYSRAGDKSFSFSTYLKKTIVWLIPLGKLWRKRPYYSALSFVFHIGLILTPIFLYEHIALLGKSTGFMIPTLPDNIADYFTLLAIFGAIGIFLGRVLYRDARALSRKQDYIWPLLLLAPFLTGYICQNLTLAPQTYRIFMLIHVYSANMVMLFIPFTKIAHCILLPLSQFVSAIGWKFPVGAGDKVALTLGKSENPL